MQTDRNIYCISGLGTDEQVFRNITLPGIRIVHIPYLQHTHRESLAAYAARMAAQIDEPDPILIGLSFGGMIGIEIARIQPVKKLIIISGVKTTRELPRWMRVAGRWQMHKWLPVRSNVLTERYDNRVLGISNEEEKEMVNAYRKALDKKFQAWAIDRILTWKNDWYPEDTLHIHGNRDRMFPLRNIQASHIIDNGTHIMIYNKAAEISQRISDFLSE